MKITIGLALSLLLAACAARPATETDAGWEDTMRTTTSLGHALGTRPAGTPIAPELTGPRTYMVLGNSLSRGASSVAGAAVQYLGGYRTGLDERVRAAGLPWTPIGAYTDNGLAHQAVSGTSLAARLSLLPAITAAYEPDVVFIYEGTVDAVEGVYDGPTSAGRLATMLTDIEAAWPDVRVVAVSRLPALTGGVAARNVYLDDFNSRLPGVLDASPQHLDGRMIRVDAAAQITPSHVSAGDGVHYPQSSHDALASLLWPALVNAMGFDAEW